MDRIPEIFIVCSGLGHIHRGYETFTRQCYDALKCEGSCHLKLFKGAGPDDSVETRVPILPRTHLLTRLAGKMVFSNGYAIEQVSFGVSLIPFLWRSQPDVVYFSDRELGAMLWYWRKLSKQKFKLLFSNGGPAPPPFPRWDHIHQVSPEHYEEGLRAGVEPAKQTLVPYGCAVPRQPRILPAEEKTAVRRRLGLPDDKAIVLSVGMISRVHKRMDYVVRELSRIPEPRPYLVLLGQFVGSETRKVIDMAHELLGSAGVRIASVPPEEVQDYYLGADVFVLASLTEGFGRVFVEAQSLGLSCIAHDYITTRYVLSDNRYLGDLRRPGALVELLYRALESKNDVSLRIARHRDMFERFSWERLAPQYAAMLRRVALSERTTELQETENHEPVDGCDSDLQSCSTIAQGH